MNDISNITRSAGDPKILHTGQSSMASIDRLGTALGWFSIGLGVVGLVAPRRMTRAFGMRGQEPAFRAFGAREIAAGVLSLSVDRTAGIWSRVAGDMLDITTISSAVHPSNPKRRNAKLAVTLVAGVALIDIMTAMCLSNRHRRSGTSVRCYLDRSGYPKGRT
jgi:hypothetical protein